MNKTRIAVCLVVLALGAAEALAESATVRKECRLRSAGKADAQVIRRLHPGEKVEILSFGDGWVQVATGREHLHLQGYLPKSSLKIAEGAEWREGERALRRELESLKKDVAEARESLSKEVGEVRKDVGGVKSDYRKEVANLRGDLTATNGEMEKMKGSLASVAAAGEVLARAQAALEKRQNEVYAETDLKGEDVVVRGLGEARVMERDGNIILRVEKKLGAHANAFFRGISAERSVHGDFLYFTIDARRASRS
jgi:hypothetical protein